MLLGAEDIVGIVGNVALGGIRDPFTDQDIEDLNFWDDDDPNEPFWKDRGPAFEKAFVFEKQAQVKEAQVQGIDPWATAQVQPDKQVTISSKAWMQKYENGRIPIDALTPVGAGHHLRPDAAYAFKAMRRAMQRDLGVGLSITDSYRTYDQQVILKQQKPTLAATPGRSNHGWGIAIDANVNDPRVYNWLRANGKRFGFSQPMSYEPWHWEYHGGGEIRVPRKRQPKPVRQVQRRPGVGGIVQSVEDIGKPIEFSSVTALPFAVAGLTGTQTYRTKPIKRTRPKVSEEDPSVRQIKRQLYQGFMEANRPDLAKMVWTRAFHIWVDAESDWNPAVTSPANNQGLPNDGLFQAWRGHAWNSKGQVARMTPYEQALTIAKYFPHLSAAAIYRYASQVKTGAYIGWG